LVLDTDVVVAAMRSPTGASAAILRSLRRGRATVCRTAEHRLAAGISERQAEVFVNALIAMAEPVETHFLWRPQLRDPNDEMVLEAAVNGRADALVTFNLKDYGDAPRRFGVDLLLPRMAIERIRR
jgi:predicted nucleic acid-binding protein